MHIINSSSIKIIQHTNQSISVMHSVGQWMQDRGMNPSKWWQPQNLNQDFLFQYAKPEEFYVALIDNAPAGAIILQRNQHGQDWGKIDKGDSSHALYLHWLCVNRMFAGMGLPQIMVDFAEKLALEKQVEILRVDANAEETKLRNIYEELGFKLLDTQKEDYRTTAFYEKKVSLVATHK